MGWITAAKGTSLSDLKATIADMDLHKGTQMQVIMDLKLPVGWAFDFIAAEWLMKPFVPDGMDLIDVYGEGSQGIVEMEADPITLAAALVFIKAHWLALSILGLALGYLILNITILIKVPAAAQIPVALLVGGALGIVGLIILTRRVPT